MDHIPAEFEFVGHGHIRLVEKQDIRLLEWHGGPDLRSFYDQAWHGHSTGDLTILIADVNRYPVGQIIIHWSGKPAHLDFPDQQSLRVHPAFRSFGLGSALIRASETLVAQRGFPSVGLSVSIENHKAKRLYERLGYAVIGDAYEDHWSYTNAAGQEVAVSEVVLDMVKHLAVPREFELTAFAESAFSTVSVSRTGGE